MYILAIETTGAFASVAVAEAAWKNSKITYFDIIGHIDGHDKFSHLQNLTPQIERVLRENELSIGDISGIAVSCGPGSFTGIRIGVSTARALSQVTGIPCIAVSSLEAMALRQADLVRQRGTVICPVIDARRNQIYGGGFCIESEGEPANCEISSVIEAGPYTVREFMEKIAERGDMDISFMGDGIDKYSALINETAEELGISAGRISYVGEECRYQDADAVAMLGAKAAAAGKTCGFEQLKPDYMRPAEAERKIKDQTNNG